MDMIYIIEMIKWFAFGVTAFTVVAVKMLAKAAGYAAVKLLQLFLSMSLHEQCWTIGILTFLIVGFYATLYVIRRVEEVVDNFVDDVVHYVYNGHLYDRFMLEWEFTVSPVLFYILSPLNGHVMAMVASSAPSDSASANREQFKQYLSRVYKWGIKETALPALQMTIQTMMNPLADFVREGLHIVWSLLKLGKCLICIATIFMVSISIVVSKALWNGLVSIYEDFRSKVCPLLWRTLCDVYTQARNQIFAGYEWIVSTGVPSVAQKANKGFVCIRRFLSATAIMSVDLGKFMAALAYKKLSTQKKRKAPQLALYKKGDTVMYRKEGKESKALILQVELDTTGAGGPAAYVVRLDGGRERSTLENLLHPLPAFKVGDTVLHLKRGKVGRVLACHIDPTGGPPDYTIRIQGGNEVNTPQEYLGERPNGMLLFSDGEKVKYTKKGEARIITIAKAHKDCTEKLPYYSFEKRVNGVQVLVQTLEENLTWA